MRAFVNCHPFVNLWWFVMVLGFSCVLMHPVCLALSAVCAFSCMTMTFGIRSAARSLLYILPLPLSAVVLGSLFSHAGVTILAYLPDGNPLTRESICYSVAAAVMLVTVLGWFAFFREIMTSDKYLCLFGRLLPALSLILSMTLRFVPRFTAQAEEIRTAQKGIGRYCDGGGLVRKAKASLGVLSATVTWSLENAVETADSMKARGYGLPKRSAYTLYTFGKKDLFSVIVLTLLGGCTLAGAVNGCVAFRYFPSVKAAPLGVWGVVSLIAYAMLCAYPLISEGKEAIVWNALYAKM